MSTADRLLTVPEVAKFLALSEDHVWRMINAGKIPSLKIGRARRVSPADLEKYLERCRVVGSR